MKEKITVIHHSADYDGLFCREIARKFHPEAELIGWDFGNAPLKIPTEGIIYVMDLPVDRVFGLTIIVRLSRRTLNQFPDTELTVLRRAGWRGSSSRRRQLQTPASRGRFRSRMIMAL